MFEAELYNNDISNLTVSSVIINFYNSYITALLVVNNFHSSSPDVYRLF